MPKKNIIEKLVDLIVAHPWIKLFSLILALLTWFYVNSVIGGSGY